MKKYLVNEAFDAAIFALQYGAEGRAEPDWDTDELRDAIEAHKLSSDDDRIVGFMQGWLAAKHPKTQQHVAELDEFPTVSMRKLYEQSGSVKDGRRFVQFLYLLMRESLPTGVIATAFETVFEEHNNAEWAAEYLRTHSQDAVTPIRLVDEPNERHAVFIAKLCALARDRWVLSPTGEDTVFMVPSLAGALRNTPIDDKTVSFMSNGWLARYCQFIADSLESGLPA